MSNHRKHEPPRWIENFLGSFLERRLLEACLGDLEEKFRYRLNNHAPLWKARLLYILEGLGFLKMRRRQTTASTQTTINMIGHTFLFFTRLVRKDKSYYLISMLGLAVSLCSFLFIMMFITDELAFDKFHEKRDRVFRISTHIKLNDVEYNQATSQFPAAAAVKSEISEVEETVRLFSQEPTLQHGDKKFEENVLMADESFFEVFSFPLIAGDENSAMIDPSSIIITRSTAKKYFGNENPLGKTLLVNGQTSLVVTGVVNDVPEQSHIQFDAIIPLSLQLNQWQSETGLEGRENKWFWTGAYTYALLRSGSDPKKAQQKLAGVVQKYFPERYRPGGRMQFQPLTDIHLTSNLNSELSPGGSMLYLRLFSIVAFVVMIVSSINLINLSFFKITSRIRELGIRKFLGQNGARIVAQLSIESMIVGLMAFVIALIVCRLFLSNFNVLVQKNLQLWSAPNVRILGVTFGAIILICILAVVRPAARYATRSSSHLLLQSFRSPDRARMRNVLIGFQVCFSFVLLVFSFIISSQIDYFKNKDLGFDKNNIVVVDLNEDLWKNLESFKNELKKSRHIVEVAGGTVPGTPHNGWRFVPQGGSYEKPFMFPCTWVDYNFLSTLNIKLLAGRNFEPEKKYDSLWPFIINKRAALELGWIDDPINKTLEIFAPGTTNIMAKGIVIGLIEDYHFESLHAPVKPIVLTVDPNFGTAIIKISGTNLKPGIAAIADTWKKFSGKPFEYEVLEEKLEKLYDKESQLSNVIVFFTFIALYLTCYGLFAMSSLLFSSRLKEVAIRKVFGADQFNIIRQLYTRYALFNAIAIVIGVPVAIYLGNLWLETFRYRIELTYDVFVKAGIYILIAGLISVGYYLARVAFSNPVRFLRSE
jgi:putative ABC transport system permease protein